MSHFPLRTLIPAGAAWWRDISRQTLRADLLAGLLGALLVLPQGVAFARLAGLPPEYGIYSALLPCVVAALFGSSRHVVSGPTNANSLALFAMLSPLAIPGSPDYIELVLVTTFMVGLMQLLVAIFRLGVLADFIAPSVLVGFTAGAACLIAYHAGLDLHGLARENTVPWTELAVAVATLVVTFAVSRLRPRWPAMLLGLIGGYLLATVIEARLGLPVSQMGSIPAILPALTLPSFDAGRLGDLIGIALALSVVAMAQSVSIAKAIADRSGDHFDPNREFFGQGMANVAASFTSSYLACGSLNRSMPNFEAGARTPLAAVFSSAILLALVAASASLLERIPMAAIAALLLYVSWTLINVGRIREIAGFGFQEATCLFTTWLAVLFIRIELAILVGVGLSLLFYLYQTSRPAMHALVPFGADRRFTPVQEIDGAIEECPQLKLVRMEGSVYFGAARHVSEALRCYREDNPGQKHLLVMAKSMNFIDQAGEAVWRKEFAQREAIGGGLFFHRPRTRVMDAWRRGHSLERLKNGHIFWRKSQALAELISKLDPEVCGKCTVRLFTDCPKKHDASG
jgi:SulP family sulfate permease